MYIINPENDIINENNINLGNPTPIQGGTFYSKVNYNNNPIIIQLPECKLRQGIVTTQKGKYCDLLYERNIDYDLIDWVEKLEQIFIKKIKEKNNQWFQNDLSDDDLEIMMSSISRSFQSGKYIYIRCHMPINKADKSTKCMIYDEQQKVLSENILDNKCDVVPLIQIDGIKLSVRSFEFNITINQVMILDKKVDVSNTCLIQNIRDSNVPAKINNANKQNHIVSNDDMNDTNEDRNDTNEDRNDTNEDRNDTISTDIDRNDTISTDEDKNDCHNQNIDNNIPDSNNSDDINNNNTTQTSVNNIISTDEKNINNNLDNNKIDLKNEDNLENLEEVELIIEEDDEIKLKSANDVYYELYREARRKAKELRHKAVEAYLEANAIKNKFLLKDLDSSSDEELDEEEDREI